MAAHAIQAGEGERVRGRRGGPSRAEPDHEGHVGWAARPPQPALRRRRGPHQRRGPAAGSRGPGTPRSRACPTSTLRDRARRHENVAEARECVTRESRWTSPRSAPGSGVGRSATERVLRTRDHPRSPRPTGRSSTPATGARADADAREAGLPEADSSRPDGGTSPHGNACPLNGERRRSIVIEQRRAGPTSSGWRRWPGWWRRGVSALDPRDHGPRPRGGLPPGAAAGPG